MDNLILQARLFEKQMQQGGEQQDANGDGLDDKTGQPIKRITTITEDINDETGQVASKETKTKIVNPNLSKEELINHFLVKNDPNSVGAQGVGPLAVRNNNQQSNNQNPPIMDAEFTEQEIPTNQARDSNQTTNNQPPNQPLNNQKPSMMDRMKGFGRGAAKFGAHAALGMATGGLGNLALNAYNKNQQNPTAPDPNAPAYMPVAGGAMSNLKNMGRGYLDSVTPKFLGGQGKPLTGDQGGLQGVWDNVKQGGANREGLTAEQTREQADQYKQGRKQAIGDKRRDGINNPESTWQDPFMQVQNSYDLESKIYDLYSLQKQQSYYREIDSTEAIRFAHS